MGYKSKFKGAEIDARLEKMVNVTYAELKALRDEGKLIAGQMYRMTDYETTCIWWNVQCAGHPFDLVLTALDNKTLDEKCSAIWSERDKDGYFANSNLPAWDVRYCLDNDTERFMWFDTEEYISWVDTNGKGVIYRLVDEAENSVPYDFKNIMFSRPLTNGKYDAENGVDTFCYTFYCIDQKTNKIEDQSVKEPNRCYNNKFGIRCYDNVFCEYDCYSNTFGSDCFSNTFGGGCYSNTFGDTCYFNTFEDACYSNTFGHNCYSNTFGRNCYSNTFGSYCSSNTFGKSCNSNTFGKSCEYNTFGDYCCSNTFVCDCNSNTFGSDCDSNTFGHRCEYNTFGVYCRFNTFGDYCYSNTFANSETASYVNIVQYYKSDRVSSKEIQVYRNRNYQTFITTDKNGNIVEYTVDDIINK